MTCPVPGCSGSHSRSAHHQQRRRSGKTWPVGPRGGKRLTPGEETAPLPAVRVPQATWIAMMREAARRSITLYVLAREILDEWARRADILEERGKRLREILR